MTSRDARSVRFHLVNRAAEDLEPRAQLKLGNTRNVQTKQCITFKYRDTKNLSPSRDQLCMEIRGQGRSESWLWGGSHATLGPLNCSSFLSLHPFHNIQLQLRISILRSNNPIRGFTSSKHSFRDQLSLNYHLSGLLSHCLSNRPSDPFLFLIESFSQHSPYPSQSIFL
jgi:hypothetical protein